VNDTRLSSATLARWQALSGLAFGLFATLHLINALFALGGPAAFNGLQRRLRLVYQFPLVEVGLLVALLVHIVVGLVRARRRKKGALAQMRWPERFHRLSGYLLLLIVFAHAAATRVPSLVAGAHPEFSGVAFSIEWMPAFYYPYYALFATAALYHLAYGTQRALAVFGWKLPRPSRRVGLSALAVGATGIVLALLAFGGVFFEIPDPMDHDYARFYESLGFLEIEDGAR